MIAVSIMQEEDVCRVFIRFLPIGSCENGSFYFQLEFKARIIPLLFTKSLGEGTDVSCYDAEDDDRHGANDDIQDC
jgi:hypothetical protein